MADALSRKEETDLKTERLHYYKIKAQGSLNAISFPSPTWLSDLKASYDEEATVKELLKRL